MNANRSCLPIWKRDSGANTNSLKTATANGGLKWIYKRDFISKGIGKANTTANALYSELQVISKSKGNVRTELRSYAGASVLDNIERGLHYRFRNGTESSV